MTGDGYPTSMQARRVFAQAYAMRSWPGYAGDDWTLQRVVRTLAMWSVCIDRMAESGPAFLRSKERQFRDHPEFGQGDPLADIKASLYWRRPPRARLDQDERPRLAAAWAFRQP